MVMLYTLPLALFAGVVGVAPDQVLSQGPLAFAILIGMSGGYAVAFLVSYYFIRRDLMTASLRALAIAGPSVSLGGASVLGRLIGNGSAIPISVASR
jgi:malonate transporter and related proteins